MEVRSLVYVLITSPGYYVENYPKISETTFSKSVLYMFWSTLCNRTHV